MHLRRTGLEYTPRQRRPTSTEAGTNPSFGRYKMNKIYSLVRNVTTGKWVVASELAKSKGKTGRRVSVVALGLLSANFAAAQTVNMNDFSPLRCDGTTSCVTTVSGGAEVALVGQGTQILRGQTGSAGSVQLEALFASGQTTSPYADPSNPASLVVNTGAANVPIIVKDPITGGNKTVLVYDNTNLIDTYATAGGAGAAPYAVATSTAVNGLQYINTRIGQVDSSGGTMTVDIGNGGDTDAAGNSISLVAKQSSLFHADGTGSAKSQIVWNSNNHVDMGVASSAARPGEAGSTANFIFSRYNGEITAFDGSVHQVNSAIDLAAYNTFLIEKLSSGALSPELYAGQFALAFTNTVQAIDYQNGPLDQNDEVYTSLGLRTVIHATGANAVGEVASGARLDVSSASSTFGGLGTVMLAEDGATILNNGQIGSTRGGYSDSQYAMYARAGGNAINNGVVNVGSFTGMAGDHDPENPVLTMGAHYGIAATGAGSTAFNSGILNVSGPGSIGVQVSGGGAAGNDGIINLNVGDARISGVGTRARAVQVEGNASFVNEEAGVIYLGRGLQYDLSSPAGDVSNGTTAMVGILAGGTRASATNKGTITLGSLAQAATGMLNNGATGTFKNDVTGVINVNGAASDAPVENVGMYVTNQAGSAVPIRAENDGTINLDGINGIGVKAVSSNGKMVSVTSNGNINVDGTKSAAGLRNYGAWAEGATTSLKIGGNVNLSGDGAIGVHSRNGSNISIDGGAVNFLSGSDQVGFFAHGVGSTVNIAGANGGALDVSTTGSTLFRIEDGATIGNQAGAMLSASGEGSTAIQVTGVGSVANLDGMDITVSGNGANALKVEGGATGQMSGSANLILKDGATAVVVDDIKYDLNNVAVGRGDSGFVNSANVTVSDSTDVTVFRIKNGAELINTGDISITHGTAIEVMGAGSRVLADSAGKRGKISVRDGIAGIHVHGAATLKTADNITVDGSASGVLIGPDAGRVVIEKDAHITGLSSGYGNLITNRAEAPTTLVDGATLEMAGSGAALLSENNIDAQSHGYVLVSSQTAGKGIALSGANGEATDGSLDIGRGWTVDVTGNGSGVYANTNGELRLSGVAINVSGSGNAIKVEKADSVIVAADTKITGSHSDAELVVGNPVNLVNNGTIASVSRDATALKLGDLASTVINNGTILGLVALGDGDDCLYNTGTIDGDVSLGGGNDCAFVAGGTINGTLRGDEGNNLIVLEGASVEAVIGGTGADTIVLRGPATSSFQRLSGGTGDGVQDTLVLDGYTHVHTAGSAALENFDRIDLVANSTFDLRKSLALGADGNGVGVMGIDAGSTLVASEGPVSLIGDLSNAGLVKINGTKVGQQLTVQGDYAGLGGTVQLNTVLGSDDSATDKLVVAGNTSGETALRIINMGGAGSHTYADGIEVVKVDGRSDGNFVLAGRAVAGPYEYLLAKGGKADAENGNWYLRSEAPQPPMPDPETPVDPTEPTNPDLPPMIPMYRPESGAYLANQVAASGMFAHTLHDRVGELDWQERQRGGDNSAKSAWSRVQRNQFDGTTGESQVGTKTNTSLLQIGADVIDWTAANSRLNGGIMVGMGRADSLSTSLAYSAKGKVTGKSIGMYGTWYGNSSDATGAYVDTWLQYGKYDNEVHGELLQKERYNSSSLSGSLEAGYAAELARGSVSAFYVEPQLQVIYSHMAGGNHIDINGDDIRAGDVGGLTTRLGARVYTRQLSTENNRVQPFAELNWWHGGNDNTMVFNGVSMDQRRAKNVHELKLGAQAELGGGWSAWGHLGFQNGDGDHRNIQGMIGAKHSW